MLAMMLLNSGWCCEHHNTLALELSSVLLLQRALNVVLSSLVTGAMACLATVVSMRYKGLKQFHAYTLFSTVLITSIKGPKALALVALKKAVSQHTKRGR